MDYCPSYVVSVKYSLGKELQQSRKTRAGHFTGFEHSSFFHLLVIRICILVYLNSKSPLKRITSWQQLWINNSFCIYAKMWNLMYSFI